MASEMAIKARDALYTAVEKQSFASKQERAKESAFQNFRHERAVERSFKKKSNASKQERAKEGAVQDARHERAVAKSFKKQSTFKKQSKHSWAEKRIKPKKFVKIKSQRATYEVSEPEPLPYKNKFFKKVVVEDRRNFFFS